MWEIDELSWRRGERRGGEVRRVENLFGIKRSKPRRRGDNVCDEVLNVVCSHCSNVFLEQRRQEIDREVQRDREIERKRDRRE
jgi:hypothetical protein